MTHELITVQVRRDDLNALIKCGWKLGYNQAAHRVEQAIGQVQVVSGPLGSGTAPLPDVTYERPQAFDGSVSTSEAILCRVREAMQLAEALGGPEGSEYRNLMRTIAHEAASRVLAQLSHDEVAGKNVDLRPLSEHLRNMLGTQQMAYDCVSRAFTDEALLHLGMLGVYIQRALAHPLVQPCEEAATPQ